MATYIKNHHIKFTEQQYSMLEEAQEILNSKSMLKHMRHVTFTEVVRLPALEFAYRIVENKDNIALLNNVVQEMITAYADIEEAEIEK